MPLVAHLVRRDLRTHRVEVTVWLLLLAAHVPFGAAVIAGSLPIHPEVATPMLILVRMGLAAITIASILQADAPSDARTFWRTRPIPRATMAFAKVGLIAALFLGAPLAVVLLEAWWLRVPVSHLPTIVFDVVCQDGALVGLMLLVATLTRRVASMVLALVATGVGLSLLLSVVGLVLRSSAVRRVYDAAPQKVDDVLPALGILLALTTWAMALYAWRQAAGRRGLAALGVAGMIAGVAVLAVPSIHASHGAERSVGRRAQVTGGTLVARTASDGGSVTLFAPLEFDGVASQADGTISVRAGGLEANGRRWPVSSGLQGYTPLDRELWVASLPAEEFAGLAGRQAHVSGLVDVDVKEPGHFGRLPLRRGEVLEVEGLRLEVIDGAGHDSAPTGRLAVTWTRQALANFSWSQTEVFFRSNQGAARARVAASPAYTRRAVDGAMLPTLAMPFGFRYVTLDGPYPPHAVPRPGTEPWLEVEGPVRRTRGAWRLDSHVTIPASSSASLFRPEWLRDAARPR